MFSSAKLLRRASSKKRHGSGIPTSVTTPFVPFYDHRLLNAPVSCDTRFTEPLESWLSLMADAVPFTKNTFVVCPSTWDDLSLQNIQSRARKVFHTAQVGAVQRRKDQCTGTKFKERVVEVGLPPAFARMPSALNDVYKTPLDALPSDSQDVIVFAGNIFGQELWFQSPSHVTAAHRVLQSHGILAVFGNALEVQVTSPDWAAQDANDFMVSLKQDGQSLLKGQKNQLNEQDEPGKLLNAIYRVDSMSCGHEDIYFPFPAVQRRWFQSDYSMSPIEMAACYRALPMYNLCYGVRYQRTDNMRVIGKPWSKVNDDFVDVSTSPSSDHAVSENASNASLPSRDQFVVQRSLDPLDVLLKHWKWNHKINLQEKILRVRVLHFVITCSTRGVNMVETRPDYRRGVMRLP